MNVNDTASRMKIFSLGRGDSIHIGEGVTVRVLQFKRRRVRLEIDVPDNRVPIQRGEVWEAINRIVAAEEPTDSK